MHVILPGYAIPLRGLFCVVFHCFVLQISVGSFAVCYIVVDYFSAPGSSSPVSRTSETVVNQRSQLSFWRKYDYRTTIRFSQGFYKSLHAVGTCLPHGICYMAVAIECESYGIMSQVFRNEPVKL